MTLLNYRKFLVAIAAATLDSNLALFLLNNQLSPITVTQVSLALAAASWPLLLDLPARAAWPWRLVAWCLGFLAISLVGVLRSSTYLGELDHFRDRLFGIAFMLLMTFLFSDARVHRFAAHCLGGVLLVSAGLNLFEAFHPGAFSQVPGRSAGLYENPNQAGAALVLAMIVAMGAAGPRARVALATAAGLGVALTFSRSAMLGWVLAAGLAFGLRREVGGLARPAVAMGLVAASLAVLFEPDVVGHLQDLGMLNRNTMGRAALEVGTESDDSRLDAAGLALEFVADRPFFGLGTGTSSEPPFDRVGPHNIYLALMVDHGIAGALIFPLGLLAALGGAPRRLRAVTIPLGVFLAYWGMFSHNVLEERYILIAVALVASMVAAARSRSEEAPGNSP